MPQPAMMRFAKAHSRRRPDDLVELFHPRPPDWGPTPLVADDAVVMVDVLGDERMHEFTGGHPRSLEELRVRYQRLETGRSPDGNEVWMNWILRLSPR